MFVLFFINFLSLCFISCIYPPHSLHLFLWYFTNVAKLFFFVCLSLVFWWNFWSVIINIGVFVGECVCVCVLLKLTCKSVLFRYPEINNKQNSKHFKLNQQKICVRVWKTTFCKFHTRKKTNVMYFHHISASFLMYFFSLNATLNYICNPYLRRNVL